MYILYDKVARLPFLDQDWCGVKECLQPFKFIGPVSLTGAYGRGFNDAGRTV